MAYSEDEFKQEEARINKIRNLQKSINRNRRQRREHWQTMEEINHQLARDMGQARTEEGKKIKGLQENMADKGLYFSGVLDKYQTLAKNKGRSKLGELKQMADIKKNRINRVDDNLRRDEDYLLQELADLEKKGATLGVKSAGKDRI